MSKASLNARIWLQNAYPAAHVSLQRLHCLLKGWAGQKISLIFIWTDPCPKPLRQFRCGLDNFTDLNVCHRQSQGPSVLSKRR